MIKANFNTYASYITDSLYQWDLNQVLSVSGLNLAVAPEVHFSNANMDRAIVRQAEVVDHVVNVEIPNSLLQDPLTIRAHIGIYEGATFKVVEKIEIPVIARKRPLDYQIETSDEEIYSFKALEAALANKADNAVINARVDNIIAHNNDTDGNSELVDVRTGADGRTYASAGTAIRKQFTEAQKDIRDISDAIRIVRGKNLYDSGRDEEGYLTSTGNIIVDPDQDWKTTGFIDVRDFDKVICSGDLISGGGRYTTSFFFLCSYDENKIFIEQVYTTGQHTYTVGDNVAYIRFCYHSDSIRDLQVESGGAKTEYEKYQAWYEFSDNKSYIVRPYAGKKWVCLGDSLTEANARTEKNYHDYVSEKTGITVVNMGKSGTGYKGGESSNFAFYQRVKNIPVDADVVTIFGSGNDLNYSSVLGTPTDTGTDTLCGCINTTIDSLIALIPNVSLGIVSPTPWISYPPSNPDNAMARYADVLEQICEYRSIPFLDLYHCSNLRPWTDEGRKACYSKDDGNGVHPDETGHKLIAPRFKAFLDTLLI